MPEVYSNPVCLKTKEQLKSFDMIKHILPNVEKLKSNKSSDEARLDALRLARKYDNRKKIIVLSDPENLNEDKYKNHEWIPANNAGVLCESIAMSEERIAAIVVNYHKAPHYYYKKVREIASAENAIMIWDALDKSLQNIQIPINCAPDILCFKLSTFLYGLAFTRIFR